MATAPHLAELDLSAVTADRSAEFLRAVARGFHHDDDPERWGPARAVFEPERAFGYTVDGRWVSTCGSYTRTMTVPGGSVPIAAVTYVTVQPSYRRRGLLRQMMRHQLEAVAKRGDEPVALLWASEAGIYGRYGYGSATAELRVSGPTQGAVFRPEVGLGPGSVGEVEAEEFRRVVEPLHARLLPERPGALNRPPVWWDAILDDRPSRRDGQSAHRFALHFDAAGWPDGYLSFRTAESEGWGPGGRARVTALDAVTPAGHAQLWRFVLDLDLIRSFEAHSGPDEPLLHLLADARAVTTTVTDGTYVRLVDLPRALEARRYAHDVDLVLGVRDTVLPQNAGTFRLRGGRDGAEVRRVSTAADVELDVRELGAVYLGGTSPAALQRAGLVTEQTRGAVTALTAALVPPRPPCCPDNF
jgi:predicted acetyltransferase